MTKAVTVIIPNFNGLKFLPVCFEAMERQTCRDFDILAVDNGSTDGSVEWLREKEIPALFLPENTGFSGAVNAGIRACCTPYVILLNNDTQADERFVEELLRAVKTSPKVFSVSGKMVQMHDRKRIDDAGDMYTLMGWAYQRGVGRSVRGYRRAVRVFSACAGAALYRREVFEEIGYFDEKHFAYLEDLDVGYRARIAGYDNIYWPGAVAYHVGSGTSGSKYNSFKVRLAARNSVYLNCKNMPFFQLALNAVPLSAGILVKYFFFKKIGFGKEYLEGLKEGIVTVHSCRKVRFCTKNLKNYVLIQLELTVGAALYLYEWSRRQLEKITDI